MVDGSEGGGAAPRRRRGGQPGNKNALRHGFYSENFHADESEDLEALADEVDLSDEIVMLRVVMRRMFKQVGEASSDVAGWAEAARDR